MKSIINSVKEFVSNLLNTNQDLQVVAIFIFEDVAHENKYYVSCKVVFNDGNFEYFDNKDIDDYEVSKSNALELSMKLKDLSISNIYELEPIKA